MIGFLRTAYNTALLIVISGSAHASAAPGEITIPYSATGNKTVGDSINIEFPATALGRCVTYDTSAMKWDTAGAISSNGTIEILSDYTMDKSAIDLDLGIKTAGEIKAGTFNANTSLDASYKSSRIRSNEERTISIVFHAFADYGRYLIENYSIKPGLPSFQDIKAFRSACGTHFIRGQHRISELAIFVEILMSSKSGKDVLDASLTRTIGGGGTIAGITGSGSATLSAAYKSIIDFARESGTVRVDYRALGGPGIKAAGEAAKLTDPADLKKLSDTASTVSASFDQANSAVAEYILLSNTSLGAPPTDFDIERTRRIGSLTRVLIKANDAAQRYEAVRLKDPQIYAEYFGGQVQSLIALKASLIDKINACAAGRECTDVRGEILENYIFLEDLMTSPKATLSCQYQDSKSLVAGANNATNSPKVLDSMSINLEGLIDHYDVIDFTALRVTRLDSDFGLHDESAGFSGFSFSAPNRAGGRRAFGTIFSQSMKSRDLVHYDAAQRRILVDEIELTKRREAVLQSALTLSAPGPVGYKTSYTIGYMPRAGCPLTRP